MTLTENRQEAYDDINVYYPPYGGYHYDDDRDNWDVALGGVVGGVNYCRRGETYYVQAYGGDGPGYMPVPPPT